MKYLLITLTFCFSFSFSFYSQQVTANESSNSTKNIEELVSLGKLTVTQQVLPNEQQIPGQALVLSIKVATDRWFATGSQLQSFSMQKIVMQANNIVTFNGSERSKGKTWATQTHEVTLYPTLAGTYFLPPININVSVNTEHNGIISGVISTEEISFDIMLPEALKGIDDFIVSPEVTLAVDGIFDEEKEYAIGEAITQTITITATDIPAMMIPEITGSQSKLDGVSVYRKPAQIFDKSNRGTSAATRIESFTYIFEKVGSYTIDEQIIYWWNSQSNSLEQLLIPASHWTVAGGGITQNSAKSLFKSFHVNVQTIITVATLLVLVILSYIVFQKRHQLFLLYSKLTKRDQRLLRNQFFAAIIKKDYLVATQYLYQYASLQNKHNRQTSIANSNQLKTLNALAYASSSEQSKLPSFSLSDASELIKIIDAKHNTQMHDANSTANFTSNKRIDINHYRRQK